MKPLLTMLVILALGPLAPTRFGLAVSQQPQQTSPQAAPPQPGSPPPQDQAAPPAGTAKTEPAQTAPTAQSAAAPSKPAGGQPLAPDQVNDLVRKVYNSSYRITDLVSLLQPDKWTMSDSDRKFFGESLDQLHAGLQALEDARSKFSGQPQNLALGDRVVAAIHTVLPDIEGVGRIASQYPNPVPAGQYKQAADQLADLGRALEAHLGAIRASLQQTAAAAPAVSSTSNAAAPQTEVITARATPPPAATSVEEIGNMPPEQVKALLHRIYAATFRVNDLVSQTQPGRWKVPEPVRDYFNLTTAAFKADAKTLEAARSEFADETDNAYLGYRVYEAIPAVLSDLKSVVREIAQFDGPAASAQFDQPAQWIDQSRSTLKTYLDFLLRNRSQVIHTYEANLAACQNTLNYSMRSQTTAARPMEPVRFVRPLQSAKIRRKEAKEADEAARAGGKSGGAEAKVKAEGKAEGKPAESTPPAANGKAKSKKKAKHTKTATTATR